MQGDPGQISLPPAADLNPGNGSIPIAIGGIDKTSVGTFLKPPHFKLTVAPGYGITGIPDIVKHFGINNFNCETGSATA